MIYNMDMDAQVVDIMIFCITNMIGNYLRMCTDWKVLQTQMKSENGIIQQETCYMSNYGEQKIHLANEYNLNLYNQKQYQDSFKIIKFEKNVHYNKFEIIMDQAFLLQPFCMFISMPLALIFAQILAKKDIIIDKKLQQQQQQSQQDVENNEDTQTQHTYNNQQQEQDNQNSQDIYQSNKTSVQQQEEETVQNKDNILDQQLQQNEQNICNLQKKSNFLVKELQQQDQKININYEKDSNQSTQEKQDTLNTSNEKK
ncbi:hypothetical protein PPERSA_02969 [Pseudocohnilembus persalinus]|uniref:Transmembrane protein n=1 Tax=Pseudocohnilembus persalinus TaxID=266149 RepID=A0A0V0QAD7_PSEPJ|nr:hypothetical protein PPERSA_02969 [Pseudocohnilembus persalinus]|eukprot:KRW99137.1 hypothetical protein PPERSA_02969 [Pseudocohnilembus persalinus]